MAAACRRGRPVTTATLLRAARVGRDERAAALERLEALDAAGTLLRDPAGRWLLPDQAGLLAGTLELTAAGYGFVRPDDPRRADVYVGPRATAGAMHGDRVLVRLAPRPSLRGPRGRIERVLRRAATQLVGVLRAGRSASVLLPHDPRRAPAMVVPRGAEHGAGDGELVVARIVRFPDAHRPGEAEVVTVLGPADDPQAETAAVIHAHGLPLGFPPEVEAAASRLPASVRPEDCAERLDLRALPLVTIDGENARDFDDAIHVARLGDSFRLTVAVADVAHYVPAGGPIDREARARGTSVYFPDRVIPMLPERLSNGICSLTPGEDRLCIAVSLEIDSRGHVRRAAFAPAVMRSAARLTYTRVREALVDELLAARAELGPLLGMLDDAQALARQLKTRRQRRGAIDFDLPEAEIVLDLRGRPEAVMRAERSIAHEMIEELMLAANEAVARELAARGLPALHRVHAPPAGDAVRELARFLEGFGLRLALQDGQVTPRSMQRVLDQARGRPEERLIHTVVLRSMMQARYAAEPEGHFGLATRDYLHFTSPIRRYPDLVCHRILRYGLGYGGRIPADLAEIAELASRRERLAMEAEREAVQLLRLRFMREQIGTTHDGIVSSVVAGGLFVELRDVFVDGFVPIEALGDEFWEHLAQQHALRGRRSRRTIRVGDPLRVLVAAVSLERRQIELVPVDELQPRHAPSSARRGRGRRLART